MMKSTPSDNKSSAAEEIVDGGGAEEESRAYEVMEEETEFNGVLISGGTTTNIGPTNPANIGTNISDVAPISAPAPVRLGLLGSGDWSRSGEGLTDANVHPNANPGVPLNAPSNADEEASTNNAIEDDTEDTGGVVAHPPRRRQLARRKKKIDLSSFRRWWYNSDDSSSSSSSEQPLPPPPLIFDNNGGGDIEQQPPPSPHDDDNSECSEPEKYARLISSIPTHLVSAFMMGNLEYMGDGVGWEYEGRYAGIEELFLTNNGNNTERFHYRSSDQADADATSIEFCGTFNYYDSPFDDKFVMKLAPLEVPGQYAISGSGEYSFTRINEEEVEEVEEVVKTNYTFTGIKLDDIVKLERFKTVFFSPTVCPTPVDTDQEVTDQDCVGNVDFGNSGAVSGTKRGASRNLSARARSPFERLRTPLQEMATRVSSTRQELIDLLGSPLRTLVNRLGSPLQRSRKKSRVEEEGESADEEEEEDDEEKDDEVKQNDSSSRPLSVLELAILNSVNPAMVKMEELAKAKIRKHDSKSGMTCDLLPPDTHAKSFEDIKVVFIWSFPVKGLARMLELSKMRVLALLNPSLDQLFQNLIRELKDNYGCTETQAANLVYDHTLWINAFPVVADWDWRSKDSFKEFAAEATDISFDMILGLLDKLPSLEAIFAVGAEGFKMLERIRTRPKYAKLITQQEGTHHGMQLANNWCTGPQIVRYLVQVVFPACSILAGRQVREVVRASDMEQLLRFVSRVADRSKLSKKELKGVEPSIKAAFENNDSVEDVVAAIRDLLEVSELAAVITGMTFGTKDRTIQPVVTHYRNRSGNQENPIADQIRCNIKWRNGANEDIKALKDIVRYILKHGQNHGIFKWQHWWEIEANLLTIFDIDLKFKYLLQKAIKEKSSTVDIVSAIRNMPEVSKLTAVITGMSFVGTWYATATFVLSVERYFKRSANPDNPSQKMGCNIEWRQGADSGNGGEVKQAMRAILDVWIKHPEFRDMGWSDILRNLNGVFVGQNSVEDRLK